MAILLLDVFLVLQPTVEDIPALPAVEDLGSSLQVKFAVVRLVGGLRLEDDVAKFTEMWIINFVFVVEMFPEQNVILKRFTAVLALFHCILLSFGFFVEVNIVSEMILV